MPAKPDKQSSSDKIRPPGGDGSIHDPALIREFQAAVQRGNESVEANQKKTQRIDPSPEGEIEG